MTKGRDISRLEDLAWSMILRGRKSKLLFIPKVTEVEAVILQHLRKKTPYLLKCIANADLNIEKEFLENFPTQIITLKATVMTISRCTYQAVSAIQLAYLMDDVEMCETMLPYFEKLSLEDKKTTLQQLSEKMHEVEEQRLHFKPYDFSAIIEAITHDQQLRGTGKPNAATQTVLEQFKTDFKSKEIVKGKSWIKEHLREAFCMFETFLIETKLKKNDLYPNRKQRKWYLINIIGHLQKLVEKCFRQECCHGLAGILRNEKLKRLYNIKKDQKRRIPYDGVEGDKLGEHYFIEIYSGRRAEIILPQVLDKKTSKWVTASSFLNNYLKKKESDMGQFKQKLERLIEEQQLKEGFSCFNHTC